MSTGILIWSKVGYQGGGVNRVENIRTAPNQVYGNLGKMEMPDMASPLTRASSALGTFTAGASKAFSVFSKISFQAFILEQGIRQIASIMDSIISPGLQFASSMETLQLGYSVLYLQLFKRW